MSEAKPVRPIKANLKISVDGDVGLLTLSDKDGNSCCIESTLEGFDWFTEQLPQLILDAQGERALGEKSALIPDRSGPQPQITTHAVTKFLLVGFDAGGTIVEFLTHKDEPIRLCFLPETAADLAKHLIVQPDPQVTSKD